MKRTLFAMILACCAMTLAAQDAIRVNYKGAKPTISDFVGAFLSAYVYDEEEDVLNEARSAMKSVWDRHRKGLPLDKDEKLTIDQKNGYVVYERRQDDYVSRFEMCYWNEADQKHKLFAYNVVGFSNGVYEPGQFDGLQFYRYNNATKTMVQCYDTGLDIIYRAEDGVKTSYALPRTGKDVTVTLWYKSGKKQKTLKWNGRRFSKN